jgi:glycosyltransferase involved in cell wall biosynthesis
MKNRRVSILIPAFRASQFVGETLDSIAQQSYQDFQVIISVDRSDDDTGLIVEQWCNEHDDVNAAIIHQKRRLGQVENVNFLIARCRSEFFMIMPHDDLLHRDYLLELTQCLDANAKAVLAFSDIQAFGLISDSIVQESTRGNRLDRALKYLSNNAGGEPFRGLVNTKLLPEPIFLVGNDCSDFAADTVWIIGLAIHGELIRVPRTLYRKRFHPNSTFAPWRTASREEKSRAWLAHCKDCLRVAWQAGFSEHELPLIVKTIESRLVDSLWCPQEFDYDDSERAALIDALAAKLVELRASESKA